MAIPFRRSDRDCVTPDPSSGEAMRAALEHYLSDRSAVECSPPRLADHELLHRIGGGSYGDVWLARNALGTLRAVKIVYRARFEDERPYEREFKGILNFEPISRSHEGLVQVLHVGRDDAAGCFYYVMELSDPVPTVGNATSEAAEKSARAYSPLTLRGEVRRRERIPPMEGARWAARLAGAVAHLHAHGLVHRDIKPGNVIFVGGQPKLADIGLVTSAGDARSFVGTEGFVPPEGPGSPQADVFSLGKLLYELLTGRDRMDFPQLPSDLAQSPDGEALLELNEVVTRACAPAAVDRYRTASELEADLRLFLAGRSLREARKMERNLTWLKRFAWTAVAFMALATVVVGVAKSSERRQRERAFEADQRAKAETGLRLRAEAAERASERQLYTALIEQARATVRSGELGQRVRALEALNRAGAISNSVEARREVFGALTLPDLRFERSLIQGVDSTLFELDPSFQRIALCHDGRLEVHAVTDHRILATLKGRTNQPVHWATWTSDGKFLAVKRDMEPAGYRARVEVWNVESNRLAFEVNDVRWGAMSFHPHERRLLVGRRGGFASILKFDHGEELARFKTADVATHLRFAPDGTRFVAVCQVPSGWQVSIHDAETGNSERSWRFGDQVRDIAWHPLGKLMAVCDAGGGVHLIDLQNDVRVSLGRHKAEAASTTFSPDGMYLFTGGWERELICWDVRLRERAFSASLESFRIQFGTEGRQCAVITRNGVELHTFERPRGCREFAEDLGSRLRHGTFSSDGRWLAASGARQLAVWDLHTQSPGAVDESASDSHVFFTPDGSELFASRSKVQQDQCFRWRVQPSGNRAAPVLTRLPLWKPEGFAFLSLRSNSVVVTSDRGSQILSPEELEMGADRWAETVAGITKVSPDGQWLGIFPPYAASLYVYRLPDLTRVARLSHPGSISTFDFSPFGDEVAVCSTRSGVELWSTATWTRTRAVTNSNRFFYSRDARSWWLAHDLRHAGYYDARTGKPLLMMPTGMIPLSLSPNGRQLAVSVDARRLQVWDLVELRAQLRELGLDWSESE